MAQKVEVMLVCDLHDDGVEGTETVSFGLDGTGYEIDLCEEHAALLRDAFAPFVGAGRRQGRGRAEAGNGRAGGARTADRQRVREIREWARSHGHAVNDRGRLPGAVLAAYEAAP